MNLNYTKIFFGNLFLILLTFKLHDIYIEHSDNMYSWTVTFLPIIIPISFFVLLIIISIFQKNK